MKDNMGTDSKPKISGFEDLFGMPADKRNEKDVRNVLLSELHDYNGHPYKVKEGAKMAELVSSIREQGVLFPGIARVRPEGGYEIFSGHSRKRACEIVGLQKMPMTIWDLTDDDAAILMVDSNIQREDLLPSEKARAYRIKYEAIRHQGKKGNGLKDMEEIFGDNWKTIQRYIWLTGLKDELMDMVDEKKIGFISGVDISFLRPVEQDWVISVLRKTRAKVTTKNSKKLKELSMKQKLSERAVLHILAARESKQEGRKLTLHAEILDKYFSEGYTGDEMVEIIVQLLENWSKGTEGR